MLAAKKTIVAAVHGTFLNFSEFFNDIAQHGSSNPAMIRHIHAKDNTPVQ
jgi:hypothetical protein